MTIFYFFWSLFLPSKERHQNLLKEELLLYQRVSINDIASYLGIA